MISINTSVEVGHTLPVQRWNWAPRQAPPLGDPPTNEVGPEAGRWLSDVLATGCTGSGGEFPHALSSLTNIFSSHKHSTELLLLLL